MKVPNIQAEGKQPVATVQNKVKLEHTTVRQLRDSDGRVSAAPVPTYYPAGHDFSRVPLQAKLTVNQPGDRYEQEADRVAEEVTHSRAPSTHSGDVSSAACVRAVYCLRGSALAG